MRISLLTLPVEDHIVVFKLEAQLEDKSFIFSLDGCLVFVERRRRGFFGSIEVVGQAFSNQPLDRRVRKEVAGLGLLHSFGGKGKSSQQFHRIKLHFFVFLFLLLRVCVVAEELNNLRLPFEYLLFFMFIVCILDPKFFKNRAMLLWQDLVFVNLRKDCLRLIQKS